MAARLCVFVAAVCDEPEQVSRLSVPSQIPRAA